MLENIMCGNPRKQFLAQADEITSAVIGVLNSESYILGDEVVNFEQEFAAYLGAKFCVGVNSGTDSIILGLKALNIGEGDEVVTPSHTAVATVAAIVSSGATPVFVDIDPVTFTIDPNRAKEAISPKTKAIIAVHLYGHPCDLDALLELVTHYGIALIEDCAQAHGAKWRGKRVGTFGILSCFSFYPTKNLGAIGDAGAVVTNNAEIAEKIRSLRQYGWDQDKQSQVRSSVSRLDELQAAILRVKLRKLDNSNKKRQDIANIYALQLGLSELILPSLRGEAEHVFHLYVVQTSKRDFLLDKLRSKGIFPGIHYPVPVHQQPAYSKLESSTSSALPVTERIAKTILSLPMYPELENYEIDRVCEGILNV